MSRNIAADFDAFFARQMGFDVQKQNPAEKKPEESRADTEEEIVEFPKDWQRDNFPRGSLDWLRASKLFTYCVPLLWEDSDSVLDKRNQNMAGLRREMGEEAEEIIATAEKWAQAARPLAAEAIEAGEVSPELQAKLEKAGGPLPGYVAKKIENNRSFAEKKKAVASYGKPKIKPVKVVWSEPKDFKVIPKTKPIARSLAYAGHPNDIYRLKPSTHWELYIDESGSDEEFATGRGGIIAGVLNDVEHPLPPQAKLHASSDNSVETIAAGDKLLDTLVHHENAGVLALPVRALRSVSGWGAAVSSLIDLVMRILPLPEEGETKLTVVIEARDPYSKAENFTFLRDACRFALSQTFPARAEKLKLEIKVMDKNSQYDAYPDLVANTCFAKSEFVKERLKMTGWHRTCYLNFQANEIGQVFDCFHSGRKLPMELWSKLLCELSPKDNHSIVDALLDRFGEEAQLSVGVWEEYLDAVIVHLNSKAINMRLLEKQIAWLEKYKPAEGRLPAKLQLGWMTASLTGKNHRGAVINKEEHSEFMQLIDKLYEEDAPLTCWAVLNLAVAYTNAFDFEAAYKLIDGFLSMLHEPAVVGKKYYGQLLSSRGQCLAFLGRNSEARECFVAAMQKFSTLSNGKELFGEILQTRAYLLSATMDDPKTTEEELSEIANVYFTNNAKSSIEQLLVIASRLAKTNAAKTKYQQHLLLRYINSERAPQALREAYLAVEKDWKTEYGHPWEMIEFYRGILCKDTEKRAQHFKQAYELADVGDVTLQVIACVIMGAEVYEGKVTPEDYTKKLETVLPKVPQLSTISLVALRNQAKTPVPAQELAAKVLPFNFR